MVKVQWSKVSHNKLALVGPPQQYKAIIYLVASSRSSRSTNSCGIEKSSSYSIYEESCEDMRIQMHTHEQIESMSYFCLQNTVDHSLKSFTNILRPI